MSNSPLSPRSWTSVSLVLVGLLVGCTDGEPSAVGVTAGSGLAQGAPVLPSPRGPASPPPSGLSPVATPGGPATPAPPPTVEPTPTPVGLAEGASPLPGVTPSPSDGFRRTNAPTDLAVSGAAYFVYATRPDPDALGDLLFSRDGQLKIVKDTAVPPGLFRLRHAPDNFFLVGFSRSGETGAAPEELPLASETALISAWGGAPAPAAGLALDADRNAQASSQLRFDYTGKLSLSEAGLRAADGTPLTAYVALARFDAPEQLEPLPGYTGIYRYRAAAGTVRLGVAVSGSGRELGNANLLVVGALATATPSPTPTP